MGVLSDGEISCSLLLERSSEIFLTTSLIPAYSYMWCNPCTFLARSRKCYSRLPQATLEEKQSSFIPCNSVCDARWKWQSWFTNCPMRFCKDFWLLITIIYPRWGRESFHDPPPDVHLFKGFLITNTGQKRIQSGSHWVMSEHSIDKGDFTLANKHLCLWPSLKAQ